MPNSVPLIRLSRLLLGVVLLMISIVSAHTQISMPMVQKLADPLNKLGKRFQVVINPMLEDSLGYIWIGTKNGLCRYSGSSIDCYDHQPNDDKSLSGDNIENLYLDSRNYIWVAIKDKGLDLFDIKGNKINNFRNNPNIKSTILDNRIWGIFEDNDGYIWISYFSGGLSRYDYSKDVFDHFSIDSASFLANYRPKTVVNVVSHETEEDSYWLSTTRGLVKFNTRTQSYKTFLFYSSPDSKVPASNYNSSKLESIWNRTMIKDRDGILWLGNFGGMVRFDPKDESYQVFFDESLPLIRNVVGIYDYDEDHLLLSQYSGLVLFSKKDYSYTNLSDEIGLNDSYYINGRFYKASNGCLYIVNANGDREGIYKICESADNIRSYTTGESISSILVTDNYINYYKKPGKIESKDHRTGHVVAYSLELNNDIPIMSMVKYVGDSILFADFHHLYMYHPSSGPVRIKDLDVKDAYRYESLLVDKADNIWSGRQRDGIYKYDIHSKSIIHYNQSSTPSLVYQDYIVGLMEDNEGDIWISTEQGWTVLNPSTNTTKNYKPRGLAEQYGIDVKKVNDIKQSADGYIWIATNSAGLIKWDKVTESVVTVYDINNGLASNIINSIIVDDEYLWLATENGLSVITMEIDEIQNYGIEDGFVSEMYAMSMGHNGTIYGGKSDGYYIIDSRGLLEKEVGKNNPMITGFDVFGVSYDSTLYARNPIILKHNENFISFDFSSINFSNPEQEVYQYILQNVDEGWIDAKGKRTKGYTALRPGEYEFQVRIKTYGEWSDSVVQKIVVNPPWYKTWWFRLLLALLISSITYSLLRFYINYQKRNLETEKRFAQLETMILKSQMNPHFIFNSLNSIRYLFMKDEKDKGLKYITKFAKLLRTTLHHGDQALVSLNDEIELTELYIALEQLRFDDQFTFSKTYPKDLEWKNILIPPFVIQPLVENAFWHGLSHSAKKEKHLSIIIKKEENCYYIHIIDNGVGISDHNNSNDMSVGKKKSYGLNLIKERFELINKTQDNLYTLEIKERVEGMEVVIIINIKV